MYPQPVCYPSILAPGVLSAEDAYERGSRSAAWSVDDSRCNRTYSNKAKVQTNSRLVGPLQVVSSIGVRLGQTYRFPLLASTPTETDTGSFVQSIKADQDSEDGLQWIVSIEYGPFDVVHQLGNSDLGRGIVCPTDRAYEVWEETAKFERFKTEDEDLDPDTGEGQPYVNTVGDPLLDPPATEETRPVINIARNEASYNDAWAAQFKDCVNQGEFLGYPPNTVKCKDIKPERIYDPDWGYYFRVVYQFEIRDDEDGNGFTHLVLNAGYRQKKDGAGDPINVTDANGQQVTDAVPLQKDGSYKPGGDPYYLQFYPFPSVDFSLLNFPDDILQLNS